MTWPRSAPIVPMACVTAAALAAMAAEAFRARGERMPIGPLGVIGLVGAALSACAALEPRREPASASSSADNFGLFVTGMLVVVGLLSLAISEPTLDRERLPRGEYYALMLFALAGMMLMATATDLLVIFLALEVLSLAVYVLTGIRRDSPAVDRGGVQVLPARRRSRARSSCTASRSPTASTGSTRLDDIGTLMAAQAMSPTPLQLAAVGLLLVGFAFKVSAVPFHMWTPDAYEGAPTGGHRASCRPASRRRRSPRSCACSCPRFEPLRAEWSLLVWGIAAATMIVGTVVGVAQTNVKRMLAYSSIAHGGYLLVAHRVGERRRQGRDPLLPADLRRHQPRRLRRHRRARGRRAAERSHQPTTPACGRRTPAWPC